MRITLSGIQRKCDDCREHFSPRELWPASGGEYCPGCMKSRRGIARAAGVHPRNQHGR